ncbi:uncharacterized protein A4U43_C04F23690 [Asparagus officinalis]|uniref:K-box domain-containing protein n=2 Tax=Asparagus officinalis TaxID=4686 RepID=A0A5P1F3T9_ASPOF|nr:uncharacterized protein A4U43_C04F23690 [Asparagus officinalis]
MQKTIERYKLHVEDNSNNTAAAEHDIQQRKQEATSMAKKIELLESSKRKLMGENLPSCSIEELHELENQLERSIRNIRGRKNYLLEEHISKLKEQERILLEENAALRQQLGEPLLNASASKEAGSSDDTNEHTDVETDLYIGWPDRVTSKCMLQS